MEVTKPEGENLVRLVEIILLIFRHVHKHMTVLITKNKNLSSKRISVLNSKSSWIRNNFVNLFRVTLLKFQQVLPNYHGDAHEVYDNSAIKGSKNLDNTS